VREWLGGMVLSRIIDYDPAGRTYRLPPEHAALLTRAAGANNMALFTPGIFVAGAAEPALIESFRHGGGVPYSAYPGFAEKFLDITRAIADATLLQSTLPLVPGLVARLEAGIDVADVACGTGHAVNLMAQAFPHSRFTGYDFLSEGLAKGQAEAQQLGLANARFVLQDAATLDVQEGFDLITVFDAIHDQAHPRTVLRNIRRALRPGGTYLMTDIAASSNLEENLDNPFGPSLYAASVTHCMTVSLAQGGEGLGAMWGEQKALELLAEAGFGDVVVKRVEGDMLNNFYICAT
jgi:ubiquinone/menaquinone biosynthesis C-methylase UbiE